MIYNAYALKPDDELTFTVRLDYSYGHAVGNTRHDFSLDPGCYDASLTLSRGLLEQHFKLCYKTKEPKENKPTELVEGINNWSVNSETELNI